MGFRFRKSVKIAPGVRLNIGKKSVGISAGVKGARVSVNSSGRKTTTVGLPGTGLSYSKTEKIGGRKTTTRSAKYAVVQYLNSLKKQGSEPAAAKPENDKTALKTVTKPGPKRK